MAGQFDRIKFLEGLYQEILSRPADAAGLFNNMSGVSEMPDEKELANLAGGFAKSREYKRLVIEEFFSEKLLSISVSDFDFFSIGDHCATANILKKFELRDSSGPFDWLFTSIPMVLECVSDKFCHFLDRSYYKAAPVSLSSGDSSGAYDHEYFKNKFGIERVFNHHNPSTKSVYEHFVRCVNRFTAAMDCEKTVLIYMGRNLSTSEIQSVECAFSKKKCQVLVFEVCYPSPTVVPQFDLQRIGQATSLVRFFPHSSLGALEFSDGLDNFFFAYIVKSFACGIFRERTKTLDSCDFFTRSLPGA
ncbi:hypothetical protein I5L56_18600 [Pseudomonas oryzihabitans]|uniref:DUF1796 family putative cysteine peptidase n=1 Tax=Pseudomonas oryzihabitans TaxID=47885 RepID=UPI0018D6446D|nr:hypothetical protein [Pseudomonas oryzihabitans]